MAKRTTGEENDQPFAAPTTVRRQPQRGLRRFDACLIGCRMRAAGDHDLADSSSPALQHGFVVTAVHGDDRGGHWPGGFAGCDDREGAVDGQGMGG